MKKIKQVSFFTLLKQISVKHFLPAISWIVLMAFLVMACSSYKVKTLRPTALPKQLQNKSKYIILHLGWNAWHLRDITLNDEKTQMSGFLDSIPKNHQYYKTTDPKNLNRYDPKEGKPTVEVHIYCAEQAGVWNSKITIPLSSISTMQIYQKDHTAAVVVPIVSGIIVVFAVWIVLNDQSSNSNQQNSSSGSSCPFVYTMDGSTAHFVGEVYGGAIYSSLERDDYMLLPNFTPSDGGFGIKISNELQEKQYTNLAELMVIQHLDNSKVLLDRNGYAQTVVSPQSPITAISDKHIDHREAILLKDESSYSFNDDLIADRHLTSMTLTFKKAANAKTAKLVLHATNPYWLDYIYAKFNEQFGTYYKVFAEKQKNVPARKQIQWALEQGIPLSVYLETEKGWQFVDYFNVMGPLASRDLVMTVDVSNVKGDQVKIKLECGFMFWAIDYAAMDFSENAPVAISRFSPSTAIDEKGNDVAASLASSDDHYLIQPEVGNEVIVRYAATDLKPNQQQTIFLHSRGYYESITDYKGRPNLLYLNSFKKKGAFTRFSKQHYFDLMDGNELLQMLTQSNEN